MEIPATSGALVVRGSAEPWASPHCSAGAGIATSGSARWRSLPARSGSRRLQDCRFV